MGAEKKKIISSINFGNKGTLPYIIVKDLMKEKKSKFSSYVRQLILLDNCADSPDYKRFRIKQLLSEREFLKKTIYNLAQDRLSIEEKLDELGLNREEYE